MEDFHSLLQQYKPLLKQHWLPLSFGLVGLIFLGYGVIALIGSSPSSGEIVFEPASEASESARTNTHQIVVDVEGAVVKPGVYRLHLESRVQDALIAASGLGAEADRSWVAKNLNLAAKLTDGAKIYIPRIGEYSSTKDASGVKGITSTTGENVYININNASEQELDSLPGVGLVTAQKIINGRPYGTIEELLTKKVVNSKVFEQIKDRISIY